MFTIENLISALFRFARQGTILENSIPKPKAKPKRDSRGRFVK
jgi:hypothetical protein